MLDDTWGVCSTVQSMNVDQIIKKKYYDVVCSDSFAVGKIQHAPHLRT